MSFKILKSKTSNLKPKNEGFIALITVLIISAIGLMIGVGLGLGSIGEMKMGLQKSQSSEAYYLANLCVEEALMTLKEGGTYTEKVTIDMENGSCTIFPIEGNWTVKVLGTASNQVKKMKIVISQIFSEMVIDSWQEVADF